jgi:hypothetical protein
MHDRPIRGAVSALGQLGNGSRVESLRLESRQGAGERRQWAVGWNVREATPGRARAAKILATTVREWGIA